MQGISLDVRRMRTTEQRLQWANLHGARRVVATELGFGVRGLLAFMHSKIPGMWEIVEKL